jgi:hypothetical protein
MDSSAAIKISALKMRVKFADTIQLPLLERNVKIFDEKKPQLGIDELWESDGTWLGYNVVKKFYRWKSHFAK